MTKDDIQAKFFPDGEEVLWFGTPDALRYFTRSDLMLVPVAVLLGWFLLSYAYSSFMLMVRGQSAVFALSGITVALVGLYLLFGRIWYRHRRLSRNVYFVTSRRVFVFNTLRDQVTADIPLYAVEPEVVGSDLYLAGKFLGGDFVYGLGLDLFFHRFVRESPAFYAIRNPEQVKKAVKRAKKKRKAEDRDADDFI